MKKNGFTLIEIIAVIALLGIIAGIITPNIYRAITANKEELYSIQIRNIEEGAKNWASDNIFLMPEKGESIVLTLGFLKENGYVDNDITDPVTKKKFPNDMIVTIINNDGIFEYNTDTEGSGNSENFNPGAPQIVLNHDIKRYIEINTTYEEYDEPVTIKDKNGDEITDYSTLIEKKNGSNYDVVTSIDTSKLSEYRLTYIATDGDLTSKTYRTVIIRDTIKPVITVNSHTKDYTVSIKQGETFIIPSASVSDNSKQSITAKVSGSVNPAVAGTYKVVYTAEDASGNQAKLTLNVRVLSAPVFVWSKPTSEAIKNSETVSYTLTLSITNPVDLEIDKNDFIINKTGDAEVEILSVSRNKTIYTVILRAGSGNGDISLTPKAGIVTDDSGTGNEEHPISGVFRVDNSAPVVTFSPEADSNWKNSNYSVTAIVSDRSNIETSLYCQTTANTCVPTTILSNPIVLSTNSEANKICVYTVDEAGNDITTCSGSYKLDKVVPSCNITGNVSDWTNSNVTLKITGEDSLSGVNGIKYSSNTSYSTNPLNYTVSSNGTYKFNVRDNALNTNECSVTVDKIDKTKPVITSAVASDEWTSTNKKITIKATDSLSGIVGYQITSDTTVPSNFVASSSTTFETVNSYPAGTYYAWAKDVAGNVSNAYQVVVSKIDTTAPTCGVSLKNADNSSYTSNTWTNQNVTATLTGTDSESGITGYSFDNGATYSSTTTKTYSTSTSINEDIKTKVRNGASLESASCNFTVKIDKVKPTISQVISEVDGTNGWYKSNPTITVTGTDTHSGYKGYKYQVSTDNGTSYSSLSDYQTSSFNLTNECSNIKYKIIGYDNAINSSSTYTSGTIKIDKTAPSLTVDGNSNDFMETIEATGSYTLLEGVSSDNCNESVSIVKSGTVNPSVEGEYPVRYTATDAAGNSKTIVVTYKVVDTIGANLSIDLTGTKGLNDWYKTNVEATFRATDTGTGISRIDYCYTTDGSRCTPNLSVANNGKVTISNESDNIKIYGTVRDNSSSGNSVTISKSFKIDKSGPSISFSPEASEEWLGSDTKVTATAKDNLSASSFTYCQANSTTNCSDYITGSVTQSGKQATQEMTITEGANNHICINATDQAGNSNVLCSNSNGNYYKIDKTKPSFDLNVNKTACTNTEVTASIDNASDSLSGLNSNPYAFDSGEYGTNNTKSYSDNTTVTAKVKDAVGNVETKTKVINNIDKTNPSITATVNPTGPDGENDWYKSVPSINVVGTDEGCGGYVGYRYQTRINNGSYSRLSSLQTTDSSLNNEISNNECNIIDMKIKGYDGAGNTTSEESKSVKYDKTAPVITVDGHTEDYSVDYEIPSKKYEAGTAIYFNPETGEICDNYITNQSVGTSNTGCLKWYIFSDNGSKDTVDMILDHNIANNIYWNSSGSNRNGPGIASSDVLGALKTTTDNWTGVADRTDTYIDPAQGYTIDYTGYKARLIEANELWRITKSTNGQSDWDSGSSTSWLYFDGSRLSGQGTSKYPWLYDYTRGCTAFGCNASYSSPNGYWTSSAMYVRSDAAFVVFNIGGVAGNNLVADNSYHGVRPVITVDKDIISKSKYTLPATTVEQISEKGIPIYFNPETGEKCDDYTESQSTGTSNTGCLKWYIIGSDTNNADMILDHNTAHKVYWNSMYDNTTGPSTESGGLLDTLKTTTANWIGVADRTDTYIDPAKGYTIDYTGYKARLIEANEIWEITKSTNGKADWNSKTGSTFEFEGRLLNTQGTSKYPWLYDYILDCTYYGCNVANSSADVGYWTSSARYDRSDLVWRVGFTGSLDIDYVDFTLGVRPVITIPKSVLRIAKDNCSGNLEVTTSGSLNSKVPGSYPIKYSATDDAGNNKTLTLTVNVKDTIAPIIEAENLTINAVQYDTAFTLPTVTAYDNTEENITVNQSGTVNINNLGTYKITYTARDSSGNEATPVEVTVIVGPPYAAHLSYENKYTICTDSQCSLDELFKLLGPQQ